MPNSNNNTPSNFSMFCDLMWFDYIRLTSSHSFFNSEQLQDIRNFNEPAKKLLNLMDEIYSEGLFNVIKTHIPKENFDNLVLKLRASKDLFNVKATAFTKLRIVSKIIHKEIEGNSLGNSAKYHSALDLALRPEVMLKHICANPEKYKVLLEGNNPVIKEDKGFFYSNYTINYDKLDWMVRKNPAQTLKNSMSLDDFTYVENLNIWEQFGWEVPKLKWTKSPLFENSLNEISNYSNYPDDNAYLVDKIYGASGVTNE